MKCSPEDAPTVGELAAMDLSATFGRNHNGQEVLPFKGRTQGPAPHIGGPCDLDRAIAGNMNGNFTHLGKTEVQYRGCVEAYASESADSDRTGFRTTT